MTAFEVRYDTLLKVASGGTTALLLGIAGACVFGYRGGATMPMLLAAVLSFMLPISMALFAVLRYEIDEGGLHVVRPVGRRRIAKTISRVAVDDDALKGGIRTFGNGGLFSYNGWYWLPKYGHCRLWVTDRRSLVVLHGERGCALVSPARRDAFIAAVRIRFGIAP